MARVEVDGLRDFNAELRRAGPGLTRHVRVANRRVAEGVAEAARDRAESLGGVARKAAPAIKAGASETTAFVRLDGARFPWALGAEFGSHRFRQFEPWRGNGWTDPEGIEIGYFLHPTIRERTRSGEVLDAFDRELVEAFARAFPD